eukprot:SAG25_NODE_2300_length_1740_cov_26.728824_3_plen_119_part_01
MRGLIFLLADTVVNPAQQHAITGMQQAARAAARAARACSPAAPRAAGAKGCQPTAPDRVPGCGGGRGRPLLPARGRTVAGGVLQHVGRQWVSKFDNIYSLSLSFNPTLILGAPHKNSET